MAWQKLGIWFLQSFFLEFLTWTAPIFCSAAFPQCSSVLFLHSVAARCCLSDNNSFVLRLLLVNLNQYWQTSFMCCDNSNPNTSTLSENLKLISKRARVNEENTTFKKVQLIIGDKFPVRRKPLSDLFAVNSLTEKIRGAILPSYFYIRLLCARVVACLTIIHKYHDCCQLFFIDIDKFLFMCGDTPNPNRSTLS